MTGNRGPNLEGVAVLFMATAIITVSLRSYVRAVMLRSLNVDDWLAVATLIFFIIFCGFVLQAIKYGAGRRLRDVRKENAIQCRWFGEFFYIITSVLVKYTAGIFLLRIISTRWQRVLIWTVLGVILVFNVFYLFIVVFQCSPPNYFWTRFLDPGTGLCLPKPFISNTAYVGSAINAWADWMLGLLPVYVVWKLNLKLKDKLLLAGVLALGSIACCATIVRMFYVWQLTDAEDFLYGFADIAIWSTAENGLGLTALSMATLRPLIRKLNSLYHGTSKEASPTCNGAIDLCRSAFHCRGLPIVSSPGLVDDNSRESIRCERHQNGPLAIIEDEGKFKGSSGENSRD
ncbi:hypothetical protein B0T10DRAFT_418702 [Thelonectria olida]|uniref:Rhodopsin domain-containing protein n=1 Tax=Thelonectria olida TaxID=1576542 RepID=A0A9P8VPS6_9HYPO|nr:hypothetical protein B0T10DRAFT_418702 [Thelonectria olida]